MQNDKMLSLKEEIFKEIHNVEKKLIFQMMVKNEEINEKNNKFIGEFNTMVQKNKVLLNSIATQNLYFDKINDFENFRKKMDSMMITHEIRINNSINDIKEIKFKYGKNISENFNVPGFIGPTCKYKTISNFLSSTINEIEKIKNDTEINKKDSKDIKRKIEENLKKFVNLVDGTNTNCIDYIDKKMQNLEETVKKKIDDFSDKIIYFKSLLMTQEKIKDIHENIFNKIQINNYNRKEIDDIINNLMNKFEINLDNFRINYSEGYNNFYKVNIERLEKEIKEISKSIKEIKMKLIRINQTHSQLLSKNSSKKNIINNNNNNTEININNSYSNKNILNSSFNNNNIKNNKGEEEKFSKFRNNDLIKKNKTIDSFRLNNNIIYDSIETNLLKEKINKLNNDNYLNNIYENNKKEELDNSLSKIEIHKQSNNYNNLKTEENNHYKFDYQNLLETSKNNNTLPNNRINTNYLNYSHNNTNSLSSVINIKNKKNEKKKHSLILKKYNKNNEIYSKTNLNNHNNHNNPSNILSFGMNNDKTIMSSIETENNINIINNDKDNNKIIKLIDDNNNKKHNNIKVITKKGGYSLHKLASIDFDKKLNEILPNMGINNNTNFDYKSKKTITPVVKKVFHQMNLKNNKKKDNLSIETPVKIMSSFGRTGYAFYDKKEEGINNLINKGIKKTLKKNKNNSSDINLGLSPVTKITVYGNI